MTCLSKIGLFLVLFLVPGTVSLSSQYLVGAGTRWNDSFKEWVLLAEEEKDDGTLEMRWELRNDWSEWDFRFAGMNGEIYLKREGDAEHWQARANGFLANARTVWPGDYSEWRLSQGEYQLTLKTVYRNLADDWIVEEKKYGSWSMFTDWEGDPRDWIIEDYLEAEVPDLLRVLLVHIVLMQSIPRR